jgi:hypothetical protein
MTAGQFLHWGAVVVPWSASWSSESDRSAVFIRTERIGRHSLRFICDGPNTPGQGRPMFKTLHNERCRDLIRRRLCQICRAALPAEAICMNQGEREGIYPLINDGLPMCRPCAVLALEQCPGLRRASEAGELRIWRAAAWEYAPVLIGMADPANGGNPALNALLAKERGSVFSGVKLVLTRFGGISASVLVATAAA